MKHIKLFENFNESFNMKGFEENVKSYVDDVEQYVDYDMDNELLYVNIPYDKLKKGIESADRILAIAQKYPKCKSAVLQGDSEELRIVFTND